MKAFLNILFLFLLCINAQGQEKYIKKAQKYVDKDQYVKALKTLDSADPELTEPFLNDYYLVKGLALDGMGDKDSALYYYNIVVLEKNLNDVPSKVIVDHAQNLFNQGDYNGALFFIERAKQSLFGTKYPDGLETVSEKSLWAIENMDKFSASLGRDSILDIRIGVHDLVMDVPTFGAAYFQDSLVFASYTEYERPSKYQEEAFEHYEIRQDYKRTNTDLYIASEDANISEKRLFASEIQTLNNEGALSFNKAGNKMYFTRHSINKHGEDLYQIYYAEKINEVWLDKGPLNFNSDHFSCLHPSLSPDGKQLYFVSDNPGGFGGKDIYLAEGKNNVWEMPKNMGPSINSAGDEIFPYLQDDSTMIFSSNGLVGFGGYDIFWVNTNDKDRTPYNLLQPVNSNSDDYCVVVNRAKPEQMLFFSDRDMSYGNFEFGESSADPKTLSFNIELLTPERRASGKDYTLYLAKGESVLRPVVNNIKRKELEKQLAQSTGILNGKIVTTDEGHVILIDSISGELINVPGNIVGVTNGIVEVSEAGTYVIVDSISRVKIVLPDNPYVLLTETDDVILEVIDSVGVQLADKDVEQVSGVDEKDINGNLIADTGDQNISTGNENQTTTDLGAKLNSIYFNKNSSELSEESRRNLEMIADYLRAKPQMKLVISGHASMRGDHSYNLCISAHRTKQAYDFLTKNMKIPESSFILVANGKYFPLIRTFNVENGLENRRVDLLAQWTESQEGIEVNFKIEKKYTDEFEAKLFRIFLKQNPDVDYLHMATAGLGLYRLAKSLNISIADIQRNNNMGERSYLYENEVVMVVPFKVPVKEMVFKARIQDLLYISQDIDVAKIALKYSVSSDDILEVNNLKGSIIPKHTRLIIPLIENN